MKTMIISFFPLKATEFEKRALIKRLIKDIKGEITMKVKAPQPFTFGEGKRAVLLLHGFTGHSADVRMLGRFLEKKGYTCHAPIMKGHGGATPEELMTTGPDQMVEGCHGCVQIPSR